MLDGKRANGTQTAHALSGLRSLVTASSHTCAVLTTGATRCWGDGAEGKLGYGNTSHVGDGLGLSIIAAGDVPVR
ncbi:MAG: hypothetical protein HS115_14195 [Spirochaetales bacterium]|nr:hypothetical protein [Spirochaetales bacterium]